MSSPATGQKSTVWMIVAIVAISIMSTYIVMTVLNRPTTSTPKYVHGPVPATPGGPIDIDSLEFGETRFEGDDDHIVIEDVTKVVAKQYPDLRFDPTDHNEYRIGSDGYGGTIGLCFTKKNNKLLGGYMNIQWSGWPDNIQILVGGIVTNYKR